MLLCIDHIGLATDAPAGIAPFLAALGLSRTDDGVAEHYGVACEFWQRGDEPAVELVSPARTGSVLDARLAGAGPGLHHVAFRVDRLEPELDRLRHEGFAAVDDLPRAGARPGMRVAFLYLPRPAGLLVELVEYGGQSSWAAAARLAASRVLAAPPDPPVNVNTGAVADVGRRIMPGGSQ
jgi:methylmalonyl-CoA/ethylmalonyl-CoA epimerase